MWTSITNWISVSDYFCLMNIWSKNDTVVTNILLNIHARSTSNDIHTSKLLLYPEVRWRCSSISPGYEPKGWQDGHRKLQGRDQRTIWTFEIKFNFSVFNLERWVNTDDHEHNAEVPKYAFGKEDTLWSWRAELSRSFHSQSPRWPTSSSISNGTFHQTLLYFSPYKIRILKLNWVRGPISMLKELALQLSNANSELLSSSSTSSRFVIL